MSPAANSASPKGERLFSLLRLGRTAILFLAGPFDRIRLLASRRGNLPPLWLRRHAGPVSKFESAAREMGVFLDTLGVLDKSDHILDIGCGAGPMAHELARRLGPGGRYVGFDVHAPSVQWCRKRFSGDPRLFFELAPIASPYGARSGRPVASYRFPMADGEAGLILAESVFTHLFESEARHYLREIARTLKAGRGAIVTAFLFDGNSPEPPDFRRAFPHADPSGRVRWRSRLRPTAAIAYERSLFFEMVEAAGLRVQWM